MAEKPKPEEWIKAAERMGNQLAEGIERFGDRVQRMIESLDESTKRRRVKVDDQRDAGVGVPLKKLKGGEVFDHEGTIFLRLGQWPQETGVEGLWGAHLTEGDIRRFDPGTRVEPVDAKVTITRRETNGEEASDPPATPREANGEEGSDSPV